MPPPKLQAASAENNTLNRTGNSKVFVTRDTSGPAYSNGHKVKIVSKDGTMCWGGPLTGPPTGEVWTAQVNPNSPLCGAAAPAGSAPPKPPGDPGGGETTDVKVTVINPGGEESNPIVVNDVKVP